MNLVAQPLMELIGNIGESFITLAIGMAVALVIINWASELLD